jgi:hypothetical protein
MLLDLVEEPLAEIARSMQVSAKPTVNVARPDPPGKCHSKQ